MRGLRAPFRTGALDPHALDGRNCRQPFLIGRDNTLPLDIWGRLRRGITPEINAISTIIIFVFSLIAIVFWYRLRTRAEGTPGISAELMKNNCSAEPIVQRPQGL